MAISFFNLPVNAVNRIFAFLDIEPMLVMREVSKSIKVAVDIYFVKRRETGIEYISVKQYETETYVVFNFENNWDYCLWKSCFNAVMTYLEITSFKFKDSNRIYGKHISSTLNTAGDVERVFKHLEPLIRRISIPKLFLSSCPTEIVRAVTDFLDRTTVYSVSFDKFESNYELYTSLIRRTGARHVACSIDVMTKEAIRRLVDIDHIAKSLQVAVMNSSDAALNPVSITRELLGRKFNKLIILFWTDMVVTIADTEALVQMLHNTERNARIRVYTNEAILNVTIGVYSIKTYPGGCMMLEHL